MGNIGGQWKVEDEEAGGPKRKKAKKAVKSEEKGRKRNTKDIL